jgi:hypothetical protein
MAANFYSVAFKLNNLKGEESMKSYIVVFVAFIAFSAS